MFCFTRKHGISSFFLQFTEYSRKKQYLHSISMFKYATGVQKWHLSCFVIISVTTRNFGDKFLQQYR